MCVCVLEGPARHLCPASKNASATWVLCSPSVAVSSVCLSVQRGGKGSRGRALLVGEGRVCRARIRDVGRRIKGVWVCVCVCVCVCARKRVGRSWLGAAGRAPPWLSGLQWRWCSRVVVRACAASWLLLAGLGRRRRRRRRRHRRYRRQRRLATALLGPGGRSVGTGSSFGTAAFGVGRAVPVAAAGVETSRRRRSKQGPGWSSCNPSSRGKLKSVTVC